MDNLRDFIEELEIETIILFGSLATGRRKGLSTTKDIDLIIVSDFFRSMSNSKRLGIINERLGKRFDPIPLTTQEYGSLRKRKESVVSIALKGGRILCQSQTKKH